MVRRCETEGGLPIHRLAPPAFPREWKFMMSAKRHQEQAELAEAQARIYHFVARFCVSAPDDEFIQALMDESVLEAISECLSEDVLLELKALKDGWDDSYDLKKLRQDYWGLFDVPGKRYLAPYESVYRKEGRDRYGQPTGMLYGPSTAAVIRHYQQAGMQVSQDFLDLPDHIGVELEFVGYLYEQEANAWYANEIDKAWQYQQWREAFLQEHLGVWISALAEKMAEYARTPLYRAAALILRSLIPLSQRTP